MGKFADLSNARFGRLVVLARATNVGTRTAWECLCDCGAKVVVSANNLGRSTRSCGCLRRERTRERKTTHGCKPETGPTPEYRAWIGMIKRCCNPTKEDRKNYQDRGITVCDRWRDNFQAFLLDMGAKPGKEYTLERVDNNAGYCKENCRWATRKEQSCNRRNNLILRYHGEDHRLVDLAEQLNLSPKHTKAIRQRLSRGWDADSAVDTPL